MLLSESVEYRGDRTRYCNSSPRQVVGSRQLTRSPSRYQLGKCGPLMSPCSKTVISPISPGPWEPSSKPSVYRLGFTGFCIAVFTVIAISDTRGQQSAPCVTFPALSPSPLNARSPPHPESLKPIVPRRLDDPRSVSRYAPFSRPPGSPPGNTLACDEDVTVGLIRQFGPYLTLAAARSPANPRPTACSGRAAPKRGSNELAGQCGHCLGRSPATRTLPSVLRTQLLTASTVQNRLAPPPIRGAKRPAMIRPTRMRDRS